MTVCTTPEYHITHRYCPSCDWYEETVRERMERHGSLVYTLDMRVDDPVFHRIMEAGRRPTCSMAEITDGVWWLPVHVKHAAQIGKPCDECFPLLEPT